MSLSGTATTMQIPELLEWLGKTTKTGLLIIENESFTTKIWLSDGKIISTSSSDPRCYFGQIILHYTDLSVKSLQEAFDKQEKSMVKIRKGLQVKTLLGKILVEENLLPEEKVRELLRRKAEETVFSLFLWAQASFNFLDDEMPPDELIPVGYGIGDILEICRLCLIEWDKIHKIFHSRYLAFKISKSRIPKDRFLTPLEKKILHACELGKTAHRISMEFFCTDLFLHRILYDFYESGMLTISGVVEEEEQVLQAPVPDLLKKGQISFLKGEYEDTIVTTRSILTKEPKHQEAFSLLKKSEDKLSESLYEQFFQRTDVPILKSPLETLVNQKFTAYEKFIISRINGTWDIQTFVKVCPLKEHDILNTFKILLEKRVISVKHAR